MRWGIVSALGIVLALSATLRATPMSEIKLNPDADYLHLELNLNASDLRIFREIDVDRNGELTRAELGSALPSLRHSLAGSVSVRVSEKAVEPDMTVLTLDENGKTLTLRQHFGVDARHSTVQVQSSLGALTGGAMNTTVSLKQGARELSAHLSSPSQAARFDGLFPLGGLAAGRDFNANQTRNALFLMAAPCLLILLSGYLFLHFRPHLHHHTWHWRRGRGFGGLH